ncbi:hypothetical protein CN514_15505 [Bacillus sp. AFS001701]|nr:hypothetical protein CN514_15505 [Bacillus sp. AFS001701]
MLKQTLKLFFSPYWKVSRKNRFIRSLFMIPGSIITALLIWKFPIPAYDGMYTSNYNLNHASVDYKSTKHFRHTCDTFN